MNKTEKLLSNFNNLQDMIKYAESKNSLLIGFTLIIFGFTKQEMVFKTFFDCLKSTGNIFLIIAFTISLMSMMPKTKQLFSKKTKETHEPNLFLYSDIASFSTVDGFIKGLKKQYFENTDLSKEEEDIAVQLYTLSNIAFEKFRAFNIAIIFTALGIFFNIIILLF